MSGQLHDVLTKHRKDDRKRCLATGMKQQWVFHKDGRLLSQQTIRRRWESALADTGIRRRRLHDIRHTFASQLLANNAPVVYVSGQLGHSNPHITLTVYAHFIPSDTREIINTLDDQKTTDYKGQRTV